MSIIYLDSDNFTKLHYNCLKYHKTILLANYFIELHFFDPFFYHRTTCARANFTKLHSVIIHITKLHFHCHFVSQNCTLL
uniref:Uncharacterized protein n=1 Tax=Arundo donax TaxID=35708 RepID=A0A0A9FZ43_ARUDO